MALYPLDNVPVHQTTSVRYERPVENIVDGNCVIDKSSCFMPDLGNVTMEIHMRKCIYVIYLFHGSVKFLFSEEQRSTR